MIKFIQGNMNRSRVADDLLDQLVLEQRADAVIISEPYRTKETWHVDQSGSAAIWIANPNHRAENSGVGRCYVWVKMAQITLVSCYLSPNDTALVFREKLEDLEDELRDITGHIIVAGDFNARGVEWGMPQTNTRGRLVLEMAARIGLTILNTGSTPTYRRPGFGYSIPDITLVTESLLRRADGWRVMEDLSGSDHNYITFQVTDTTRGQTRSIPHRKPGWNPSRVDVRKFDTSLLADSQGIPPTTGETHNRESCTKLVEETMRCIHRACKSSMPQRRAWSGKKQVYWWNDRIAELRRACHRMRRLATRARGRPEALTRAAAYKSAKKALGAEIQKSKRNCWKALCDEVDRDPWGQGYKIVMKKFHTSSQAMDEARVKNIVDALFPTHPLRADTVFVEEQAEAPLFSTDELKLALRSMKAGKAPGPDGIPAEAIRLAAKTSPDLLLNMYNSCLRARVFPSQWKKARLVLIPKGKGDPNSPSSFRPLCMLDTAGKMMESLLKIRLTSAIESEGGLSPRQHGFRKGHSTIGAIGEVVEAVHKAEEACHQARPIVLLVTLDVKNAFNSARWDDMLEALERSFKVPTYLLDMIRDYLRDRWLLYDTTQGQRKRRITGGAAQGSVLGPDLWNATYDSLLRTEMPESAFLVAFADDVAAVITARNVQLAQLKLNQVMRNVSGWMSDHGLQLATAKTEIVLLTRKRIPTIINMMVGPQLVTTSRSTKYLGVKLDSKLTFWEHIHGVCEKAAQSTVALSRLMANVGGPKPCRRKLLMTAVQSVLLYGAEIWADALKVKKYRIQMSSVQRRGALRIASAYRTVSADAVLVISGVMPIELLAYERKEIYNLSAEIGRAAAAARAREQLIQQWQQNWNASTKGRWTHSLIADLQTWLNRPHGEVDFYLTQFLTGHGYFREYLHRMGRVDSPFCHYCGNVEDNVYHTFFTCEHFLISRRMLEERYGDITPNNIVGVMISSAEKWEAVARYVKFVLRCKREDGCLLRTPE